MTSSVPIDPVRLRRVRWRCRRGLLENDLVLQRFLARHGEELCDADVAALDSLLDLTDKELLDLILGRAAAAPSDDPRVHRVLAMLRAA
ncbi:MAG TPA: succinate dehydrogenase assembly factor 2 [Burkholderiaceae bacterium]|nr:succinate dehydrogenase assembly factor 2 [Burkholderiaceae bacterium]